MEEETATHSSTLAWRIPWTEGLTVHGVTKSQTRLSDQAQHKNHNGRNRQEHTIVVDFNTPRKINKETEALNNRVDQMELTDIYRAFFSGAHGTFSRADHMLGHKASLGKFKKTEIVSSFFYHHAIRLEINYKK